MVIYFSFTDFWELTVVASEMSDRASMLMDADSATDVAKDSPEFWLLLPLTAASAALRSLLAMEDSTPDREGSHA